MNFLFVTQFFPGAGAKGQTGGTISNLNFLRTLARSNKVTVISFDKICTLADFEGELFTVIHRPPPHWRAPGLLVHWQAFVKCEVRNVLDSMQVPDVVFATTSTLASFDVCDSQTRCCAIIQAYENFGYQCKWVPVRSRVDLAKQQILRRFRDASLIQGADALLTNSLFMKSAIIERFNIDERNVYVLKQSVAIEPDLILNIKNIIGFVHRGADKNIALIVELAHKAPDLAFHVYGHGNDIPDKLPTNIVLKGWCSNRDAMFASAALWLVPSRWAEPFGRVAIEAQAANRAVLVAAAGGLPETVLRSEFHISGFNPEEWLARMRALLAIPVELLSKNGAEVRQRFSHEAHDQAIEVALAAITSVE